MPWSPTARRSHSSISALFSKSVRPAYFLIRNILCLSRGCVKGRLTGKVERRELPPRLVFTLFVTLLEWSTDSPSGCHKFISYRLHQWTQGLAALKYKLFCLVWRYGSAFGSICLAESALQRPNPYCFTHVSRSYPNLFENRGYVL